MTNSHIMEPRTPWPEIRDLARLSRIDDLPRHERKKLQTRDRIYRAALALFAEKGLEGTTVDQITEVADVGKGTFFNYFHSKEQVFGYFIELQLGKVGDALEQVRKGRPIRSVLRRAFRRLGGEIGTSPNLARALIAAVLGNDISRETVATGMAQARHLLAEILRIGQERGEVRRDRRVEAMGLAFQQAVFGTLVVWAIRPQAEPGKALDVTFRDYWTCVAAREGRSK